MQNYTKYVPQRACDLLFLFIINYFYITTFWMFSQLLLWISINGEYYLQHSNLSKLKVDLRCICTFASIMMRSAACKIALAGAILLFSSNHPARQLAVLSHAMRSAFSLFSPQFIHCLYRLCVTVCASGRSPAVHTIWAAGPEFLTSTVRPVRHINAFYSCLCRLW
jgi:hypothetical protein